MQIPSNWGGNAQSGVQRWPQLDSTWHVLSADCWGHHSAAGTGASLRAGHPGWPEGLGYVEPAQYFFVLENLSPHLTAGNFDMLNLDFWLLSKN